MQGKIPLQIIGPKGGFMVVIKDNGGRRLMDDRRICFHMGPVLEKRSGKDRRSGRDRRAALAQNIDHRSERRQVFSSG